MPMSFNAAMQATVVYSLAFAGGGAPEPQTLDRSGWAASRRLEAAADARP